MWLWKRNKRAGLKGYCLRTCREAWDLPADQPSAIKEWESIPAKYKNTDWRKAPVGAPHFWAGGEYGHVAIQSRWRGFVYSTDAPIADRVGTVNIGWFRKRWGYRYLGWAKSFQNERLPL